MQTQPSTQLQTLRDEIKEVKVAMLFTQETDNSFRSRPMYTHQVDDQGNIWFFTWKDSDKVRAIQKNPQVNIAYADPGGDTYVTVSGTAQLVLDRAKMEELWKPILKAWFPDGLEDPNISLLKIAISKAEYWDASSNKVVQLIGLAKSLLTGKPHEGEGTANEKLKF
jgi:general stress protein 26